MRAWAGAAVSGLAVLAGLAGCSSGAPEQAGGGGTSPATGQAGATLTGTVRGGQQAIMGAHVYLLAANTTGYGGAGLAASTNDASLSLLKSAANTALDTSGGATNGDYYVTTDANGSWTITGDYTCTQGQQVYLYSLGGNTGAGVNTASGLMAALGACPAAGNFLSATPFVLINEVSTVATAYAIAGFATDATHVSSSGTALAATGIANAFATVANLETLSIGTTPTTTPAGNGTLPQAEINTLANILAACINSNGAVTGPANATPCYTLFTNALASGTTGAQPTDTATAAINIAHNPGSNVAALYGLTSGTPPFAPALTGAPKDWTLMVVFTGPGLNNLDEIAYAVAIDASDNVWVASQDSPLVELSSLGVFLSGANGFTDGNQRGTTGLAIDLTGNAWLANAFTDTVSKFSSSGSVLSGSGFSVGGYPPSGPQVVAIDASNNAWIGGPGGQSVFKLSNTGSNLSGTNGYSGGGLALPIGIGFDGAGNAWVANYEGASVTELSNSGTILSGASGYTSGISEPVAIALDSAGNAWVATRSTDVNDPSGVTKISNSGSVLIAAPNWSSSHSEYPYALTLDGAGNAWVTSGSGVLDAVFELSNSGAMLSPANGYAWGKVSSPEGIAVDGSGNVWIADQVDPEIYQTSPNGGGVVEEFVGAAVPVITPIAAGLPATPTVDGSSNLATRP